MEINDVPEFANYCADAGADEEDQNILCSAVNFADTWANIAEARLRQYGGALSDDIEESFKLAYARNSEMGTPTEQDIKRAAEILQRFWSHSGEFTKWFETQVARVKGNEALFRVILSSDVENEDSQQNTQES